MAKRKPKKLKQIKHVTKNYYLKFRNKNGYTKHRTGRKYTVEVFSKRTHKRVGVLNRIDPETQKPIARRFSSFQIKFKKIKTQGRSNRKNLEEYTFTITSDQRIIDQMEPHKKPIVRMIKARLKKEPQCLIAVDVTPSGEPTIRSLETVITRGMTSDDIMKAILIKNILDSLYAANLRMSAKKRSRNKTFRHKRRATVTVFILDF